MESTGDEEVTNSTQFIPRRRPPPPPGAGANSRRSSSRPHSIGALIISNPKLVKGWQYYDNSPNQRDIQKYFSSINLGASTEESFLNQHQQENSSMAGGTGKRSVESGPVHRSSYPPPIPDVDEEVTADLVTGREIKAVVSPKKKQCCAPLVKFITPILGILLTLIASTCLALSSILIESLPPYQYHPYSVLMWTSQGLLWPSVLLLLCPCQMKSVTLTKPELPPWRSNSKPFIISVIFLRAIFGWTAVLLSVSSLNYITYANSFMIHWTSPVFVLLIGWLLVKDRPGWIPTITAVVAIVGCAGILQPSLLTGNVADLVVKDVVIGCSLAAAAMMLEDVFCIIIIRHVRHVHFAVITLIHGLVGTGGGILLYFTQPEKFKLPVCKEDTTLAIILCLLVFLGHTGIFGALKYEQVGIFAVVYCFQVPMMVFWRYWVLNEDFSSTTQSEYFYWLSWIGIALIELAILVLILRKLVYSRPRARRTRRWLGSLLY